MNELRSVRGVALSIVLAGVPATAACNMITGADDVRFSDDDDGSSSAGGTGSVSGVGGAAAAQQAAATGVGGATTGSASSTSVASTGATGAGAGPTSCEYPVGPYSVAQGGTVPPSLSWQGYVPGSNTPSTISIQDLFDCDGSRGIDAIIIDTSQYG